MTDTFKLKKLVSFGPVCDDLVPYHALREDQLLPFFQPLISLRTGQLSGFEILARWQHPTKGLLLPEHFIGLAEREGWIGMLTQRILEKAFAAACVIPNHLTLAINVSPFQLRDSRLPEQIHRLALDAGFAPARLVVEITESALIDNLKSAGAIVAEVKALGCTLALDDFGTGYSSLHHLQSLPFDQLKVDRSFVSSMTEKRDSRKIVAAVVGLGQSLGMTTIAEGIETQEQAEMMLCLGCDEGQGYLFGRAMPAEQLAGAISTDRRPIATDKRKAWKRSSASFFDVSPVQRLAQLQAIYDGAPVGLAFVDRNFRYINLNERLSEMNGVPVEMHLGRQISEVLPELFPLVEPYLRRAVNGESVSDVEARLTSTGATRLISYQPAFDEAGEVVGVAIAATDITERKRTEDALEVSRRPYKNRPPATPEVLWITDHNGWHLGPTPRWDKTTGKSETESGDHKWRTYVHPDDIRATVRAIAVSKTSLAPIDVTYCLAIDDGGSTWRRSIGVPRLDLSGNVVCWYGSIQDADCPNPPCIDFQKPIESAVNDTAAIDAETLPANLTNRADIRRRALLDLEILDTAGEAEFDDLVALASEICTAPISAVSLIDSERQWFKASIGLALCETPISSSFCAHAIEQEGIFLVEDATKDERFKQNPLVVGDPMIRFYAGMPLYAREGVAVGTLCVIDTVPRSLSANQMNALAILSRQVQARIELRSNRKKLLSSLKANRELTAELQHNNQILAHANSQLERLVSIDSLTGMLNRRAFEDLMNTEYSKARRGQRPLSLLIMDIDNFKMRNDQFGHAVGDEALRQVSEVVRKVIRAGDSAARIGGEEFAIVLPETTTDQASFIAKRLQELLTLLGNDNFPRITLSIGIACLGVNMTDWGTLLAKADHAMYAAKQAGKNRCVVC